MTRFAFLDHVYEAAWAALPHSTMDEWWQQSFGTSNFWELALKAAGHEATTFVQNHYNNVVSMLLNAQGAHPEIVVSMEAARFTSNKLREWFPESKRVAFCSHRVDDYDLQGWDMVFSSFGWMPDYCKAIGVRCEYLPLAFGRPVLDMVKHEGPRDIPVCFIGGLGMRTWKAGTETMAGIAANVPSFQWWGYCQGSLSDMPVPLQKAYRGEAYGKTMYELLMRSLVVVNRHGEIARGVANNCRTFEAQGCGALLLNDCSGIPGADGIVYDDADSAVRWIESCLDAPETTMRAATRARERILAEHTFDNRVPRFMEVIGNL